MVYVVLCPVLCNTLPVQMSKLTSFTKIAPNPFVANFIPKPNIVIFFFVAQHNFANHFSFHNSYKRRGVNKYNRENCQNHFLGFERHSSNEMSQRNRSTRGQRVRNVSPRPSTSQRAYRDSSPEYDLNDLSQQTEDDLRETEKKMFTLAASKYILAMTRKKLPIKCSEVAKNCMHGENRLFSEIFALVTAQLSKVSLTNL